MDTRRVLRWLRAHAHEWSGANARCRAELDGSRAVVLFYHRVLPRAEAERDAVQPGMYVTPETFGRQLDWLRESFEVLPLHEITARVSGGHALPRGACAISFDDGWRDNLEHALPQLSRRGLPATLFVVTERVGSSGSFWPDEVWRRLARLSYAEQREVAQTLGAEATRYPADGVLDLLKPIPEAERGATLDALRDLTPAPDSVPRELLDWDELDRLAAEGIDVESHCATHAILTGLSDTEVDDELRKSREALRARGHGQRDLVAYPSGGWDQRVCRIAAKAGYRAAFTVDAGLVTAAAEPMALPRLGIHEDVSAVRAEFLYRVPGRV